MIIGHQSQLKFLEKIVKSKKIPQALLFSGPERIGKRKVAFEFIFNLFGQNPINHPDFILIEPKENQIQIDQIRELSWKLSLKPIKAPFKVAILDKAHLMTIESQNCFLKTLEEPKGKTIIILITEYPNLLLPTILSRCEIIKFFPPKKEEIREFLIKKGIGKEKIEEILEFSFGKPGLVIEFLENPKRLEEIKEKERELREVLKSPLWFRFQYLKEITKKGNLKEILEIWLNFFHNLLLENLNSDFSKILKIKEILQEIQNTIFLISMTNVNKRLALETLLLKL